jgi:hypothetical protein
VTAVEPEAVVAAPAVVLLAPTVVVADPVVFVDPLEPELGHEASFTSSARRDALEICLVSILLPVIPESCAPTHCLVRHVVDPYRQLQPPPKYRSKMSLFRSCSGAPEKVM